MHDPDRLRRAQERGEQRAARLRRVGDRDRLAREQQRAVEILVGERLRAEPLGDLRGLGVTRLAALDEREDPTRESGEQQDRDPGE